MSKRNPLTMTQSRRAVLIKSAAATLAATGMNTPGVVFNVGATTVTVLGRLAEAIAATKPSRAIRRDFMGMDANLHALRSDRKHYTR